MLNKRQNDKTMAKPTGILVRALRRAADKIEKGAPCQWGADAIKLRAWLPLPGGEFAS